MRVAVALMCSAVLVGCGSTGGANPTGGNGGAGGVATFAAGDRKPAPELSGELLDGSRYDPATYRGKVLVVNFWASWCAPCNTEAPELEAAHEATKANAVFLGVNIRDDRDKAKHNAVRRWVAAVNHGGGLGRWAFHVCRDPHRLGAELARLAAPPA